MPITYARRKELHLAKAIVVIQPYVLRYLRKHGSAVLDKRVGDPLLEGVRKHFYGFKGRKDEVVEVLNKLGTEDINKAILRSIRDCLESPELQEHLKKRAATRRQYLIDNAGRPKSVFVQPKKNYRPRMFKPLDRQPVRRPKLDMQHDNDVLKPAEMDAHQLRRLIKTLK